MGYVKNSENDMGTLSEWPRKIAKFGGENIYYIFVIYNFNDKTKEVLDVVVAPFYQFIGLNSDGLLKYRKRWQSTTKNFWSRTAYQNTKTVRAIT